MSFIREDFLLYNKTAEKLYNDYASKMPIFDYHCHLPEKEILENAEFKDLFEVWLKGDHYKWRAMRNYGVDEEYITGNKPNKEKFLCFCKVAATLFGNPLYHWSHVELKEFFNCELEINEKNAEQIWDWCNDYIKVNKMTPQSLIEKSNVKYIFTTNEVFDDLTTFEKIAQKDYKFKVIPAFRADKIMNIDAAPYLDYIKILSGQTLEIKDISDLEKALEMRLEAFIEHGTKASDIALEKVYPVAERAEADKVFKSVLGGKKPTEAEAEIFKGYFTYFLMKLYAQKKIATELHVGAMRNNNSAMLAKLGLDTGYDSITDENSIKGMSRLFDKLDSEGVLPKTIVFNLNPKMNMEIMTLIGCFQSSEARGKIQYGPAWWFLDNKVYMEKHLEDLTATGHIGAFIGMLTDSRSFLSYPRHHYFRRILCNYLGTLVERGEITADLQLVGKVIEDVCYNNSINYLGVK